MTREEAIKALREKVDFYESDKRLKAAIETLIPELTESEDERIRKWLIDHIRTVAEYYIPNLDSRKIILAWLEKQKRQKPDIEICPHSIRSKSYKENGYPIENCDYGLEIAENILEKTLGKVEGYQSDDGIREHQTAIQAVKDAIKEQKPAEWSDNFEENIRKLLHDKLTWHSEDGNMSSTVFIDDETLKDIINGIWFYVGKEALKYPNKELNAAEWSEEDEDMLNSCISSIEEAKENRYAYKETDGDTSYDREINWLKSLRPQPHWKPSEEQMKALRNFSTGVFIGDGDCDALRSLYEDLKKL